MKVLIAKCTDVNAKNEIYRLHGRKVECHKAKCMDYKKSKCIDYIIVHRLQKSKSIKIISKVRVRWN